MRNLKRALIAAQMKWFIQSSFRNFQGNRGKVEKLSKTQKMPYLYQKVDNKKSEGTFLGQHFTNMIIFKNAFFKSA